LRDDKRTELIEEIVELGRGLAGAESRSSDKPFEILELLKATIEELTKPQESAEEWHRRLKEARHELKAAQSDLVALRARVSKHASEFAYDLGVAQARLEAVELHGPMIGEPRRDPLDWLVGKFGRWAGAMGGALLQPMMVFLDGIPGQDNLATGIVAACRNSDVRVACFNVFDMAPEKRVELYSCLAMLRTSTPLAVSDFVLTLKGGTPLARDLAKEFRQLCEPANWQEHAVGGFNLDHLRQFYIDAGTKAFGAVPDARRSAFAKRLISALSALDAADTAGAVPSLYPHKEEQHTRWLGAAHRLMGSAMCFDAEFNIEIRDTFGGAPVEYVGRAGHQVGLKL
jgi:hypothetical protein